MLHPALAYIPNSNQDKSLQHFLCKFVSILNLQKTLQCLTCSLDLSLLRLAKAYYLSLFVAVTGNLIPFPNTSSTSLGLPYGKHTFSNVAWELKLSWSGIFICGGSGSFTAQYIFTPQYIFTAQYNFNAQNFSQHKIFCWDKIYMLWWS